MNVIITGGAGFIGANLAIELDKLGHGVTVLDNFITGNLKNLGKFSGRVVQGDEKILTCLAETFDIVYHLAAITDTTSLDRADMFRNNVEGFRCVLDLCQRHNKRLIFASSAAVYGDGEVPMAEDQNLRPLNVYAESKMEMERIARKFFTRGTVVGLRFFNVYGPREHFKGKMASMTYKLAMQMREGRNPRIFKYGGQKRDHIYVKDVVESVRKASDYDGFGLFNIATGVKTSFNELIDSLNKALGTHYEPKYFDNPYEGSYQNVTLADTTRAERELNFKARYTVETGIKDYIEWLDETGWND